MENFTRMKERELREAYKTIPNVKCKTFDEFTNMVAYWCKRCPKNRQ
jgi:hypothetical protein